MPHLVNQRSHAEHQWCCVGGECDIWLVAPLSTIQYRVKCGSIYAILTFRLEDTCCICKWLSISIAEHDIDLIILLISEHMTVRSISLGGCSRVGSLGIVDCWSLILGLHILAMPFVSFWKPNNEVATIHQVSIFVAVGTFKWLTWRCVGGLLIGWRRRWGSLDLHWEFVLISQRLATSIYRSCWRMKPWTRRVSGSRLIIRIEPRIVE